MSNRVCQSIMVFLFLFPFFSCSSIQGPVDRGQHGKNTILAMINTCHNTVLCSLQIKEQLQTIKKVVANYCMSMCSASLRTIKGQRGAIVVHIVKQNEAT